jgi:hypothetical protein
MSFYEDEVKAAPIIYIRDFEPLENKKELKKDKNNDEVVKVRNENEVVYREEIRRNNDVRPVVKEEPELLIDDEIKKLTPGQINETFWELIQSFQWCNVSEGNVDTRKVRNTIANWSNINKIIFKDKYAELFALTNQRLKNDNMFVRNNVQNPSKVISHMIALGMEAFNNLFDDLSFVQILIELHECQNLNELLPLSWQL